MSHNPLRTIPVLQDMELPFCRSIVGKKMELVWLVNTSSKTVEITVKGTPLGFPIPANGRFSCVLCQGEFVQAHRTIFCNPHQTLVQTGTYMIDYNKRDGCVCISERISEPICRGPLGLGWDGSILVGEYRFPVDWGKTRLVYVQDGVGIDENGDLIQPVHMLGKHQSQKVHIAVCTGSSITGDRRLLYCGKEVDFGEPVLRILNNYDADFVQTCNGDILYNLDGGAWNKIGPHTTAMAATHGYFAYADSEGRIHIYRSSNLAVEPLCILRRGTALVSELDICEKDVAVKFRDGTYDIIDWHCGDSIIKK